VLAAAVPPYLHKGADNPEGGLDDETIAAFGAAVAQDRVAFLEDFTRNFFSANGELKVSEAQRPIVPIEVSGNRSAELIEGAQLVVVQDGPHGINASHADEFNEALLAFLAS